MLKTFVHHLIFGMSAFCCTQTLAAVHSPTAQAQARPTASLLPLQPRTFEIEEGISFEAVSEGINTDMADSQFLKTSQPGLALDSLPLIGDLLDEEGNFDWGMNLPMTVNLGDVMGETGLVLGTDFSVE
ncbi:MAG: hypothetical protein WA885_24250 [Phormidesmis sp.]